MRQLTLPASVLHGHTTSRCPAHASMQVTHITRMVIVGSSRSVLFNW
ncbi:MAG TPA: hypothetical protein VFA99_07210 [Acidobacteriaceae bacterium]|nr:hypothetical protein [Acidobacteriaceae bacterium]